MVYAGFWPRVGAFLVDIVILALLERLLSIPARSVWVIFAVNTLYFFTLFTVWRGQTLGKKLFGLRVVRVDGRDLDPLLALLRAAFYAVDELLAGLGFLLAAIGPEHRALHDLVLGTRVIKVGAVVQSGGDR